MIKKIIIIFCSILAILVFTRKNNVNLNAYTKAQISAMKAQYTGDPSDLDYLVPEDSNNVSPLDKEKALKTFTIKDKNNKVIFIGTLDDKSAQKRFNSINNYFERVLSSKSIISSAKYNLTNGEITNIVKKYESCTNRNYVSCITNIEKEAKEITDTKEKSNLSIIYFDKIVIYLSIFLILFVLLGTKKVVINDKNR